MKDRECEWCGFDGPMLETLEWQGVDSGEWCEQIHVICLACGESAVVWDYAPIVPPGVVEA